MSAIGRPTRPSVISAVAARLVDALSGPFRSGAVGLFGTNDKAALVTGIVVVSVLVGAVLGVAAVARPWVATGGFVVFAVIGVAAERSDPQGSGAASVVACALGALAGIVTLRLLLRMARAVAATPAQSDGTALPDPRVKVADRRTFLLAAGGAAAVAALSTTLAPILRGTSPAARTRARLVLPPARRAVAVPPSASLDVNGLTPFITANRDFYRIDTSIFVPEIDIDTWRMSITGMVDHPVQFSYTDLLAMDLVDEPVTMACVSNDVGGHLVGNAVWRGVPLSGLLQRAGVQSGATQIVGRAVDDFTVGFPTALGLDGRVAMVAIGMNGEPLPLDHGYPARLIVAGLYGYVSATKWLKQIELTRWEQYDAYWVSRGWSKDGPIKTQSRIDVPASGAAVRSGTVTIAGVAWAPSRGIRAVEVRVDNGPWEQAQLGAAASGNTWVQWRHDWNGARPGVHVASVRATDGTGQVQTDQPSTPAPDGATGYHYRGFRVV